MTIMFVDTGVVVDCVASIVGVDVGVAGVGKTVAI